MPSSKRRELKVVLDANVWVSALLWGGKPAALIKAAEGGKVCVYASESIVREISRVLTYPKLARIFQAEGLHREELVAAMLKVVKFVEVAVKVDVVAEHPADDKFVECALAAGAEYIVSGDKHLLRLGSHGKIRIVSVSEFLQIVQSM